MTTEPTLIETAWQTAGPFLHLGLAWPDGAELAGAGMAGAGVAGAGVAGERVTLAIRVFDANGPVDDALIETWQANAHGRYAHPEDRGEAPLDPGFVGFGRVVAGPDGVYTLRTVRPGRVAGPGNSWQAAHLAVSVFSRGLMQRLVTRVYFADSPGLDEDPALALVPAARRATLLARPDAGGVHRWDIHLQGDAETVFFSV
jgi:protocatechuate 3,4-dioxygenase alpha subunit